ncbi:MAG: hypothetical protein ACK4YU_10020, partial [Paracoccus sp. (in: a-proteobacteria)]
LTQPAPPPGSWTGALALLGHILLLGAAIIVLHSVAPLDFQEALIVTVPVYSALWAAVSARRRNQPARSGVAEASRASWQRLSQMGAEIGVFASAGFLPVLLLALVPLDALRAVVADLGAGAVPLAVSLAVSIAVLAFAGVNPIVSASVLGAIAVQLAVPGLNETAIALAITGGWTAVIGLSPFITTIIITASITGRSVWRVGPGWNAGYSVAVLVIWCAMLSWLIMSGWI